MALFRDELAQVVLRCPDIINISERVLNRTVFVASAAPDAQERSSNLLPGRLLLHYPELLYEPLFLSIERQPQFRYGWVGF